MSGTVPYPLDVDVIEKGSVITKEQIAEITGCVPGTDKFSLGRLKLGQWLEKAMAARGKDVVIGYEGNALHVLTDEEAAAALPERFDRGIGMAKINFRRQLTSVDVGALGEASKKAHDRSVTVNGIVIQAIRTARREAVTSGYKRESPTLAGLSERE